MQRSTGRQGERDVGTSRARDSTVDPCPTAWGSSLATATVDTALGQQITSPASCSYSFGPDLLGLQIPITVFIVVMVSSQQGLGLLQGTKCSFAQMQVEVRAANTSELGTARLPRCNRGGGSWRGVNCRQENLVDKLREILPGAVVRNHV